MRSTFPLPLVLAFTVALASPPMLRAQLLSQSELTLDDVDPAWEMTLEHLSIDSRWTG